MKYEIIANKTDSWGVFNTEEEARKHLEELKNG